MATPSHISSLDKHIVRFLVGDEAKLPKAEHSILHRELQKIDKEHLCTQMLQKGSRDFRKRTESGRHSASDDYRLSALMLIFQNAIKILPLSYWTCDLWLKMAPERALKFDLVRFVHHEDIRTLCRENKCRDYYGILHKPSLITRPENAPMKNALISLFLRICEHVRDRDKNEFNKLTEHVLEIVRRLPPSLQQEGARRLGLVRGNSGIAVNPDDPTREIARYLDVGWAWRFQEQFENEFDTNFVRAFGGPAGLHVSESINPDMFAKVLSLVMNVEFCSYLIGDERFICRASAEAVRSCLSIIRDARAHLTREESVAQFVERVIQIDSRADGRLVTGLLGNSPSVCDIARDRVIPDVSVGTRQWLLDRLRMSTSPVHLETLFADLKSAAKSLKWLDILSERTLYQLMNDDPSVYHLGRNAYGCANQVEHLLEHRERIIDDCIEIMLYSGRTYDRQWSTAELNAALPVSSDYFRLIDEYKLVYVLKGSEDMVYWGRMMFSLRGMGHEAERFTVRTLLHEALVSSGRRMSSEALLALIREKRSISVVTFASALQRNEFFIDECGNVGLSDRDLPGNADLRKRALSIIETWVVTKRRCSLNSGLLFVLKDGLFHQSEMSAVRETVRYLLRSSPIVRLRKSGHDEVLVAV